MSTVTVARSQDEILARVRTLKETREDFFGFRTEVLFGALDAEHARELAKPEADLSEFPLYRDDTIRDEAESYLGFAIGKAADHRGLSANRSIDKLGEFAWLAGNDEALAAMEAAGYAQYGVPKLKAFADAMGFEWPEQGSDPDLDAMLRGEVCPSCRRSIADGYGSGGCG